MHSCLYEGVLRHRRFGPVANTFAYGVFQLYLDLSELDEIFRGRWLWSTKRFNLAWFRRADHLGDAAVPLDTAVRDLVECETGKRPAGPIRLLTHLRYLGYCMNPVSFYYCFDAAGARVETIVAEVHNTPWGERHCYVLDESRQEAGERTKRYRFRKEFHVSPYMPMQQGYDWRFGPPGRRLVVHMVNEEGSATVFDATLLLRRRPINGWQLARVWWRYPWMTAKVIAAIYWQALRLWAKRCPYYPHPKHSLPGEAKSA